MNAPLLSIILILFKAAYELRSTSYGQNTHRSGFPVCHFVLNYTHNSISKEGIRIFYLSNDCSTIISILLVRAVCETRQAGYESKHERNYFSIHPFVYTYTRNPKTTGCMVMFYIPNDCSTIRVVGFLRQSWMQNADVKVHLQTCIPVAF